MCVSMTSIQPSLYAQEKVNLINTILERTNLYSSSKSSTSLFVHFDKTIYTGSERVYFTAYLLNTDLNLTAYHTLSVALIRNDDRKISLEEKFVIRNGISSGSLVIPDSIFTGNYSFIVYANRIINNWPEDIFIQPITINNTDLQVSLSLVLLDSLLLKPDTLHFLLKAVNKEYHPIQNTEVSFIVRSGTNQTHSIKILTDKNGEALFAIAQNNSLLKSDFVQANIIYNGISRHISLPLPAYNKGMLVNFYPEGGNLVENIPSVVGWEIKSLEGAPIMASGFLYKDQTIIDTIYTNGYGLGRFQIVPQSNSKYSVKLNYENGKDTIYRLPGPLSNLPVISITKAITEDTLQVQIRNANSSNKMFLLLHNFTEIFAAYEIKNSQSLQSLSIPLTKVPKGVNEITLLDNFQRPIAERLFFAHYDRKPNIQLIVNHENSDTQQKIEISLKLDSFLRKSNNAIVSISCVKENSINIKKLLDIESYFYLNHTLSNLPFTHLGLSESMNTNTYLEDVLLIKGWSRYSWADLIKTTPTDTITERKSLFVSGKILKNDRPIYKSIEFNTLVDSTIGIIKTDNSGNFTFTTEDLLTPIDKKINLFMNKNDEFIYKFDINDQYHFMNKKLATELFIPNEAQFDKTEESPVFLSKNMEATHLLPEVTVKAKNKDLNYHTYIGSNSMSENECGDYVCVNDNLNCPAHKGSSSNRPAVYGQRYFINGSRVRLPYFSCKDFNYKNKNSRLTIKGISYTREVYFDNNDEIFNNEIEHNSTIYWNPSVLINSETLTKISFNHGNASGKFRIIVQGRTENDVVYCEKIIILKNVIK